MGKRLRQLTPRARSRRSGFTLVELAVVVAIVALLLGALLAPLATQYSLRKNKEGERALASIKEALLGFAVTRGRLPCPDTDAVDGNIDGLEDTTVVGGVQPDDCTSTVGILPWQTLGIFPADPWGRLYHYQVTQEFAYPVLTGEPPAGPPPVTVPARLALDDVGTLTVMTRADDKSVVDMTTTAVAVVWSTGGNGQGGRLLGVTTTLPPPAAGTDEERNLPNAVGTDLYVLRVQTPVAGACSDTVATQPYCEFDDLVTWISAPELFNRLVQAGLLP